MTISRPHSPRRSLLRLVLGIGMLIAVLVTGVAFAASLGLSSTTLTTIAGAASISTTTCTLTAADADSDVDQVSPGTNSGTATTLRVRSQSGSSNRRAFVQFNLASCAIPANALITVASLRLFMSTAPTASRTYDAHRVSATWTEAAVNWTNQPATAATATSSVATGTTSSVTLTWAVTADVQAFSDGTTNYGWRIKDLTESSSTARSGTFRSAEWTTAAQRPILAITYYP